MSKAKHKLKIALFHLGFIYSGGGEKLVLQEYDGLKARGHNVSIFTAVVDKKKCFPDIINKYKIRTFLPNFRILRTHEAFQTILGSIMAPFYAFKFKKYDVILACNQPSLWIAFVINKIYGIPYISYLAQPTRFLHLRRIDTKTGLFFAKKASDSLAARLMMTTFRSFSNWADRISVKGSYKILVNGEYVRQRIKKVYNADAISCPSGVKARSFKWKRRKPYLLVTNRHFAQKRFEYAIFALNSLVQIKPYYRLIITGSNTEYTQKLRSLVSELGLTDKVDFVEYVSENKLKNLYRNASVYLYTAPEEDFGMGVVEAMSQGTPVVTWNNGGPGKIIENGKDGFLIKPNDSTKFAKAVIELVKDKRLARIIGKNAYQKVSKKFSLKRHMDILEENLIKFSK